MIAVLTDEIRDMMEKQRILKRRRDILKTWVEDIQKDIDYIEGWLEFEIT